MLPTKIHVVPSLDSFTPLADHQSQTPTTFFNAKPVLHCYNPGVYAATRLENVSKLPIFNETTEVVKEQNVTENGESVSVEYVRAPVDVFVTSETLIIFNHSISTGVSVPYPAITLHAIQNQESAVDGVDPRSELYMHLALSDPHGVTDDEDEWDIIELSLGILSAEMASAGIQPLYKAVTDCANLHPDPTMEDDEGMEDGTDSRIVFEGSVGYEGIGGLPPPVPGSGGWITAENVHEHFDEDGNWIGENGEALGEGAGRVRTHGEVDGNGVNGHNGEDSDDNKRPRTD